MSYTLSIETRTKISNALKGRKKGPFTIEHRNKLRDAKLGKKRAGDPKNWRHFGDMSRFGKQNIGKVPWNIGKKGYMGSNKSSFRVGDPRFGENHHSWKGGVTPINEKLRRSAAYKVWRNAVFTRDDYVCQKCSKRGGKLHADHELPFAIYSDLRFEVLNGQTLCAECHRLKTVSDRLLYKKDLCLL